MRFDASMFRVTLTGLLAGSDHDRDGNGRSGGHPRPACDPDDGPAGQMTQPSAHVDTFVIDGLPPADQWPHLDFDGLEVTLPGRMNAATELLDKAVERGGPTGRAWPTRCTTGRMQSFWTGPAGWRMSWSPPE